MMMKRFSASCALMVLAATSAVNAAPTGQDTNFAVQAAQGGMAEVKLAALAMQKSKNPSVLAFARRMSTDHTQNNAQLAAVVKSEGMMPPSDVGAENKAVMAKLQGLSGAAFNTAYLSSEAKDHQKMSALLQKEATSGSDPKLVAYAKQTLPVVQQHLAMARMSLRTLSSRSSEM